MAATGILGEILNWIGNGAAQALIAGAIFSLSTWVITSAFLRAQIVQKEIEAEQAKAQMRRAMERAKAMEAVAAALKRKLDEIASGSLEGALTAWEREDRAGNFERAAGALQDYFDRARKNLSRLAGALGDWYAGLAADGKQATMCVPRAQGFYSMAHFADPDNDRWMQASAGLEMSAAASGTQPEAEDAAGALEQEADGAPHEHGAAIEILLKRGAAMRESGNFYGACQLARRACSVAQHKFGRKAPATLSASYLLANCLYSLGSYEEALPYALEVLTGREKTIGRARLETGEACSLAGRIYLAQANLGKAEEYLERALTVHEKALGIDHPGTVMSLHDLASLYDAQGRFEEAGPLYRRAVSIAEKLQAGPNTATTLNGFAEHYRLMRRFDDAGPLFARALAIREKVLGANHPATAESLNNLAGNYCSQERYADAEPLFKRALEVHEKALGGRHTDTATSLNNLAGLYWGQGRYDDAEPLFKRALAIKETALGTDHPDTLLIKANLERMFAEKGLSRKAS
jgi:tetratricopeptide (TPR) repeat protein